MSELEDIRPQIDYPCKWGYKIIAFSEDLILNTIEKVFDGKADVESKHQSKNEKYIAISCSITVQNDDERRKYFDELVEQPGIVMVL